MTNVFCKTEIFVVLVVPYKQQNSESVSDILFLKGILCDEMSCQFKVPEASFTFYQIVLWYFLILSILN
jgi:hypothetical protein